MIFLTQSFHPLHLLKLKNLKIKILKAIKVHIVYIKRGTQGDTTAPTGSAVYLYEKHFHPLPEAIFLSLRPS